MDPYRGSQPCALLCISRYDSSTWTPGWRGTTLPGKISLALFPDFDVQLNEGVHPEVRVLAHEVVEAVLSPMSVKKTSKSVRSKLGS